MNIKITTFNCENLFGRYRILDKPPTTAIKNLETLLQIPEVVVLEPGRSGKIKPAAIAQTQRTTTGKAILGAAPDILAVQEVENLSTLRIFNHKYLGDAFDRVLLVDGNDARGIDVGLLLKKGLAADVTAIQTHADEALGGGFLPKSTRLDTTNVGKAIFSRDCLEVDLRVGNRTLTFLVNHFKAQDNKPNTPTRRLNQAKRVLALAKAARSAGKHPIVIGDLNIDTAQADYDQSLQPLFSEHRRCRPLDALLLLQEIRQPAGLHSPRPDDGQQSGRSGNLSAWPKSEMHAVHWPSPAVNERQQP